MLQMVLRRFSQVSDPAFLAESSCFLLASARLTCRGGHEQGKSYGNVWCSVLVGGCLHPPVCAGTCGRAGLGARHGGDDGGSLGGRPATCAWVQTVLRYLG